jgi:hypothetical protein
MSEPLRVNPAVLHRAGGEHLDAMDESSRAHAEHHESMESAMPGLPTEAGGALAGLIAAWTDQREDLHRAVGAHGFAMQEAASMYRQADQEQAGNLGRQINL